MSGWTYRVFGLDIRFPREVPTLRGVRIEPSRMPDVEVTFGPVPPRGTMETVNDDLDVAWHDGDLTIAVEEVGRFLVSAGRTLVVEPYPQVGPPEVDLYLTGSIMGAILHQRAILPLHCNAFECGGQAILLCGDSGAGKSTLAAWLEARGYALLTDDVCAIGVSSDGPPLGHPGMPRLRLWNDAIEAMGRSGQSARAVPWTDDKFELEMDGRRARHGLPIAAIYHLTCTETDQPFAIAPIDGLAAIDAITSCIYRRRLGDLVGRTRGYLQDAVRLSRTIPVFRVSRTWGMHQFEEQSGLIEHHFKSKSSLQS